MSLFAFSCKKEGKPSITAGSLPESHTNIIVILGDDVGYELPTFTGGRSYATPTLDMMAHQGIQFSNFYSHPDGSPSRMAFLTGKYNFRNYEGWGYLPPAEKTIGNLLHDYGYKTCYVGKWQLDGGHVSINRAGFDNYRVFLPFGAEETGLNQRQYRYKNPHLYENGDYMPASETVNKYSEDMFLEYAGNFIDNVGDDPFFLIFSHNLVGRPFVPTPDDPEFESWDPAKDETSDDLKYFPSMVNYMDKTIGKLIEKVRSQNLANKTVIIYTGDNATSQSIQSQFDSVEVVNNVTTHRIVTVRGGKNNTSKPGTHLPFTVYWPGNIVPAIDASLVDFTDLLPTIADIAQVHQPTNYGVLDGKSFINNITGTSRTEQRPWVFCQWSWPYKDTLYRFVHDHSYKLYDSINNSRFYNIVLDPKEKKPLNNQSLNANQISVKKRLQAVLDQMH